MACLFYQRIRTNTVRKKDSSRLNQKKLMKTTLLFIISLLIGAISCGKKNQKSTTETPISLEKVAVQEDTTLKSAYFASGCFWCVEAIYEHTIGVKEAINGYAGGHTKNPTYGSSNTGTTGHAEAVKILYDPDIISFNQLVDIYFATQNIRQVNGQGPDHGSQYRSILFYQNEKEKIIITKKIALLKSQLGVDAAAEIKTFEKFWIAEKYHQNYERLHPDHPYIKSVSNVRLEKFKTAFPTLVKK